MMRWIAMSIMWLSVGAATIGTAYYLRPGNQDAAVFVAVVMTVGATAVSIVIVQNDPATFEDSPK